MLINGVSPGLRVKIMKLSADTKAMAINPRHLTVRKEGIVGQVYGPAPGYGGDIWFVEHAERGEGKGQEIGAYCFDEFEPTSAVLIARPRTQTRSTSGETNMDLQGTPKMRFRIGLMVEFMRQAGMAFVPRNECMFGLGAQYANAGVLSPGSELHTLLHWGLRDAEAFILPRQYVSVEGWKKAVYEENIQLAGPRCIWGDFTKRLRAFTADKTTPAISILNADYMCGIEQALPQIKGIFEALEYARSPKDSRGTLIAINVISDQRWRRTAMGHTYPPPLETLKAQPWFRSLLTGSKKRDKLILVDKDTYENKLGLGTEMQTLVFWWGLKRDLSGIRGWIREPWDPKPRRKCSFCHEAGHYCRTCPRLYGHSGGREE